MYEYTPASDETTRIFRLDVLKASFVATTLEKGSSGWQFFSAPIIPQRDNPFVNFGDDVDNFQLYQYNTGLSGYEIYPLDIGEVGVIAGHAYFTRLKETVEVDVGGAPNLQNVTLELTDPGWHAVGNPFTMPVNLANLQINGNPFDQAVADGLIEITLYRWNAVEGGTDGYEAVAPTLGVDQLEPWAGYWLKTAQENITLMIPAPPGLANFIAPLPDSFTPPLAPNPAPTRGGENSPSASEGAGGRFDLRFALTSDFAADLITTLGAKPDAKTGKDLFDTSEPPMLEETVSVYFDCFDWGDNAAQRPISLVWVRLDCINSAMSLARSFTKAFSSMPLIGILSGLARYCTEAKKRFGC